MVCKDGISQSLRDSLFEVLILTLIFIILLIYMTYSLL